MNHAAVTEVSRNDFATAVRDFTPPLPAKLRMLMPIKEGIAELRCKGASYETIADILRNIHVTVSHDTVARFCQKMLGVSPVPRRKQKRTVAQRPSRSQRIGSPQPTARGPRVADPNNV
ncbi:MAG: hypothetical protein PCFJNLEI_01146 [Verrucomicrobiae bacterium]|nr:hypothetical protein [Verrucomicrobiae bacterium]